MGGRKVDLSPYPAVVGRLTRNISFLVNVQKTSGATSVEVQLFDVTDAVQVTSTNLTHSANNDLTELSSGSLTVGSSSGNLRSDAPKVYEVNVRMNGGGPSDQVFVANARLLVTYT